MLLRVNVGPEWLHVTVVPSSDPSAVVHKLPDPIQFTERPSKTGYLIAKSIYSWVGELQLVKSVEDETKGAEKQ